MSARTSIVIFDVPAVVRSTNKTRLQLDYEELEKSSSLPKYHFTNFYEMETAEKAAPNSTMISVLCKQVMQYCTPIIAENAPFTISLQNDKPIEVCHVTNTGNTIATAKLSEVCRTIPPHLQMNIAGLIIPRIFAQRRAHSFFDMMRIVDIATTGRYGLKDHLSQHYAQQHASQVPGDVYFHNCARLTQAGQPHLGSRRIILFESADDARAKLRLLLAFISWSDTFYGRNANLMQLDLARSVPRPKLLTASQTGRDYIPLVLAETKVEMIPVAPSAILQLLEPAMEGMIIKRKRAILSQHTISLAQRWALDANHLLFAYNVAKIHGIDNLTFRRELATHVGNVQYKKQMALQKYDSRRTRYTAIKQSYLARHKYAMLYSELNKTKRNVIARALKQFNIHLLATVSERMKKLTKLFDELRRGMNEIEPQPLTNAIRAVEAAVSETDLTGSVLIEGNCPHVYAQAKITKKAFGQPDIARTIMKELVLPFALPHDMSGYFCHICGEKLSVANNEGELRFVSGNRSRHVDDPLQTMIWKETTYIISSNVRFPVTIPVRPLLKTIAISVRQALEEKNIEVHRSRTINIADAHDMMNLYAAIYIYAALSVIIVTNPGEIIFARSSPSGTKKKRGGSEFGTPQLLTDSGRATILASLQQRKTGGKLADNPGNEERRILTVALNLLLISKENVIHRLASMSDEAVKHIFLRDAYMHWARKYAKPIKVAQNIKHNVALGTLTQSTYYHYLVGVWHMSRPIRKVNSPNARQLTPTYKQVLGRTIDKLDQDLQDGIGLFATVPAQSGAQWDFGNELQDKFTWRSFLMAQAYIAEKIFDEGLTTAAARSASFRAEFADVTLLAKKIQTRDAQRNVRPAFIMPVVYYLAQYSNFNAANLGQYYCKSGQLHVSGEFIYMPSNTVQEALRTQESAAAVIVALELLIGTDRHKLMPGAVTQKADLSSLQIVNERCARCKLLIRSTFYDSAEINALKKQFERRGAEDALFRYFDARCPMGALHQVENDVCIKCGKQARKRNLDYYKKYIGVFREIQVVQLQSSLDSLNDVYVAIKAARKPQPPAKVEQAHKYSLQNIAKWSQLTNVKYNVLSNLGLSDGIEFSELEAGRIDPKAYFTDLEDQIFVTQAITVRGYVTMILREYNTLRNYRNVPVLPHAIDEILSKARKKELPIDRIEDFLPKINDFMQLSSEREYKSCSRDYANFLLEYLAGLFIRIMDAPLNDPMMPLRTALVKHFTGEIVRREQLHAKQISIYLLLTKAETRFEAVATPEYELNEAEDDGELESDDLQTNNFDQMQQFGDAYDVENAADIWDTD